MEPANKEKNDNQKHNFNCHDHYHYHYTDDDDNYHNGYYDNRHNNCDEDNDKHTGDDDANYNNNTVSDLGGMNSQRAAVLGSCHLDRGVPCHIACVQIGIPH